MCIAIYTLLYGKSLPAPGVEPRSQHHKAEYKSMSRRGANSFMTHETPDSLAAVHEKIYCYHELILN